MNKLAMLVLLLTVSACSNVSNDRVKRPDYGGYTAYGDCIGCRPEPKTEVDMGQYGHNFQRPNNERSFATMAGAFVVGGLIYKAILDREFKDDTDSEEEVLED